MRSKRFVGMLAIFWGVFFLLPMMFGGMRARAFARSEHAQARYEAMQQAQTDGATADTSAEAGSSTGHHHHHGHHGYGPFGFFAGIFKLFLLGFLLMKLGKIFRHRRRHGHRHHSRGEKSPDDLTGDIRVGDEINRAEAASAAAQSQDMPSPDEMTVDDLVMAMKRLGIKKLEL